MLLKVANQHFEAVRIWFYLSVAFKYAKYTTIETEVKLEAEKVQSVEMKVTKWPRL